MLQFGSPHLLWLLLLVPLAGLFTLKRQERRSASVQYSDLGLFRDIHPGRWLFWCRLLPMLRLAALVLLIVALARPRFGTVERDIVQEGVDLFYCLDISGSMTGDDFQPNRLEKAKELTAQFAARRETDRQGIVLFAEEAFLFCPLTFDQGTVQEFLENVTFDPENSSATAIGMGLARCLKKLEDSKAKSKVVILMTDGENNTGQISPAEAMRAATTLGVKVYTIGIGSEGYATFTVSTPYGPRHQRAKTSIDEELLQKIARETGGIYRRAASGRELEAVLDEIDKLEKTEIEMQIYRIYDERMAIFAWMALALLAVEVLLANTRFLKIP
ncbi:VWA domain-containing protein [bacterium]|nr:VWA domain-containing protein [bacterium]